jgi:hypothetical protein
MSDEMPSVGLFKNLEHVAKVCPEIADSLGAITKT